MNCDLEQFGCIKEELEKYSVKLIDEFAKLFPPTDFKYYIGGIVWFKDADDFWHRWNKFKNLRAFL